MHSSEVVIEYCTGCRWLLRASWTAQELLTTFEQELSGVTLRPSAEGGRFRVSLNGTLLHDRKDEGGFIELKELKQRVRDHVSPDRNLGHSEPNAPPA